MEGALEPIELHSSIIDNRKVLPNDEIVAHAMPWHAMANINQEMSGSIFSESFLSLDEVVTSNAD